MPPTQTRGGSKVDPHLGSSRLTQQGAGCKVGRIHLLDPPEGLGEGPVAQI